MTETKQIQMILSPAILLHNKRNKRKKRTTRIKKHNKIFIVFVLLGALTTILSIKMIMNYYTTYIISPTTTIEKKNMHRLSSSSSIFDLLSSNKNHVINDNNNLYLIKNSNAYKEEWLNRLYKLIKSEKEKSGDDINTTNANVRKVKKTSKLYNKNDNDNKKYDSYNIRPRVWNIDDNNKSIKIFLNQKKNNITMHINNEEKQKIYYHDKSSSSSEESEEENEIILNNPRYTGKLGKVNKYRHKKKDCIVSKEWHTYNPTTCNNMHEIDINSYLKLSYKGLRNMASNVKLLSSGSQREAWIIPDISYIPQQPPTIITNDDKNQEQEIINPIILKTLRYNKDYTEKKYLLNRIDALAVERLTSSKYVVNGYGYCGMTTLNEYADGGDFHTFITATNETTLDSYVPNLTMNEKIIYARDAALGLSDIHTIQDDNDNNDNNNDQTPITTLVHRDIRSRNFLIIKNQLKYHDFNNAQFLTRNIKNKKQYCGYPREQPCVISSLTDLYNCAPEEWNLLQQSSSSSTITSSYDNIDSTSVTPTYISEKVDIYHLGTFFYKLLTNDYPYQYENMIGSSQSNEDLLLSFVLNKKYQPFLPTTTATTITKYNNDNDRDMYLQQKLIELMNNAMDYNSLNRLSANEIANQLVQLSSSIKK